MDEKEATYRLRKGEDPLELSIEKWQNMRRQLEWQKEAGVPEDEIVARIKWMDDIGPLCLTYLSRSCRKFLRKCPVYKATGLRNCRGTPYREFIEAVEKTNVECVLETIIKEIGFLESLRRKNNKIDATEKINAECVDKSKKEDLTVRDLMHELKKKRR